MTTRRSLLIGAGALALETLLTGCGQSSRQTLSVQFLKNSVPAQVLGEFERELKRQSMPYGLKFSPANTLEQLFDSLKKWQTDAPKADLVTLGDFWLTPAIQNKLVRPISTAELDGWSALPERWKTWLTRDAQGKPQPNGQVWGIPYGWGELAIAYRTDNFEPLGWTPRDWADLWRPELKGQFSLPDHARAVIGLVLKSLGESVNQPNLAAVGELPARLQELHQQVKLYSSSAYLQPLILGDTWLAVGWSTDIWPLVKRDRRIQMVVPQSGTMLTADLWVRPTKDRSNASNLDDVLQRWLSFGLQPKTALQFTLLGSAIAPQFLDATSKLPPALKTSDRIPSTDVLNRSEFLEVLPPDATAQYRDLWVKTRQGERL